MPTYEYRCKACGHELEVQQSFTDEALTECPECQGALRKVYGNVGIAFKGSGFYKNDARPSTKKSSSTATSSDAASTSSTDATPAKDTPKKADSTTTSTSSTSTSSSD